MNCTVFREGVAFKGALPLTIDWAFTIRPKIIQEQFLTKQSLQHNLNIHVHGTT
jgi:hypothetical protein